MKTKFPELIKWIPVYGIIKAWADNKMHPLLMLSLINYNALILSLIAGLILKIYIY